MTMDGNTCSTCRWFKPVEDGRFMSGGWCNWRAPMIMRDMLWGRHNERVKEPAKEWCAEHQRAAEQSAPPEESNKVTRNS